MRKKPLIICVVGARPNFMKIAPIMAQLRRVDSGLDALLVHTGQHYDAEMKHQFFDQLGIPEPDVDLGVGSGSHAQQTAEIMRRFEPVLDEHHPVAVLVVGDVNSTIACALVAAKKGVKVIHVEAGLRSYDRTMPEEVNRVLTDQISDYLFTTERSAHENLAREGIPEDAVHFVGNVMIDTLRANLERAIPAEKTLGQNAEMLLSGQDGFAIVTMHRPSNVDDVEVLKPLLESLRRISESIPLVFPVHPRTASRIEAAGLVELLDTSRIVRTAPLGYLQLVGLMKQAKIVLTDSGGIQEETTALGVPCITMRENTERPITVTDGTNTIVGTNTHKIEAVVADVLKSGGKAGRIPEYWDGRAAERIVAVLEREFSA